MKHETRERPTIMDGKVVTFAQGFDQSEGIFGPNHEATGPFEISASRNCVTVHSAQLRSAADVAAFCAAIIDAEAMALRLSREDRGNFRQ